MKACRVPFESAGRPQWALIAEHCLPWDSGSIRLNPQAQTPFERRKQACLLGQKRQTELFRCTGLALFEEREIRFSMRLSMSLLLAALGPLSSRVLRALSSRGLGTVLPPPPLLG